MFSSSPKLTNLKKSLLLWGEMGEGKGKSKKARKAPSTLFPPGWCNRNVLLSVETRIIGYKCPSLTSGHLPEHFSLSLWISVKFVCECGYICESVFVSKQAVCLRVSVWFFVWQSHSPPQLSAAPPASLMAPHVCFSWIPSNLTDVPSSHCAPRICCPKWSWPSSNHLRLVIIPVSNTTKWQWDCSSPRWTCMDDAYLRHLVHELLKGMREGKEKPEFHPSTHRVLQTPGTESATCWFSCVSGP